MRNKVKRTLSFLLTFVMLCSLLPMTAMAVPGDVTASKTAAYNKKTGEVTITMTVQGESVTQSTTREEKLPVFLYVLNQTDGETTADPADYSYLATGAKVKADTSMETPYTGKEAQNQIASWNVGGLGNHDGYAEVSSTPVGAEKAHGKWMKMGMSQNLASKSVTRHIPMRIMISHGRNSVISTQVTKKIKMIQNGNQLSIWTAY